MWFLKEAFQVFKSIQLWPNARWDMGGADYCNTFRQFSSIKVVHGGRHIVHRSRSGLKKRFVQEHEVSFTCHFASFQRPVGSHLKGRLVLISWTSRSFSTGRIAFSSQVRMPVFFLDQSLFDLNWPKKINSLIDFLMIDLIDQIKLS